MLLVAAVLAITRKSAFPGWWALLPTLGACLVIAAGPRGWVNRVVFSNRAAVLVGKISYPLYLWHWPLLVFPTIVFGHPSRPARIAVVALALLLAWLTYEYVEKPIRFGKQRRRAPAALAGAMVVCALTGGLLIVSDGWVTRLSPEVRSIATAEFKSNREQEKATRHCLLSPDEDASSYSSNCKASATPGARRVWLWGDSHSDALYPGFKAVSDGGGNFVLSQHSASACPPVIGYQSAQRPHCREVNDVNLREIILDRPDTVVLAANWTYYNGTSSEKLDFGALARTASRLRDAGVRRVVIVGQFPRWQVSQPLGLLMQWRETGQIPTRNQRDLNPETWSADQEAGRAATAAGVVFFSPMSNLCNRTGCLLTVTAGRQIYPIAWDDAHLTSQASIVLVQRWQSELLGDRPPD